MVHFVIRDVHIKLLLYTDGYVHMTLLNASFCFTPMTVNYYIYHIVPLFKTCSFVPTKQYLRETLLHYFILKETGPKTFQILVETYDEQALSEATIRKWFQFRFKRSDFNLMENHCKTLKMTNCIH